MDDAGQKPAAVGDTFSFPIKVGTKAEVPCEFKVTSPDTVQVGRGTRTAISPGESGAVVLPSTVSSNGVAYRVTAIGSSAFKGCSLITTTGLRPDDTITEIGGEAYRSCEALTETGLANNPNVTKVSYYAFFGCTSLKTTGLGSNRVLSTLGEGMFASCTGLEHTGLATNEVITDLNGAFSGCEGLIETGLAENKTITKLTGGCFYDATSLVSTGLESNDHITELGKSDFAHCTSLKTTGLEHNVVQKLGDSTFWQCISLESTGLETNTKIKKLEDMEFDMCESLKSTGLESNQTVSEMGSYVFTGCTSLLSTGLEANATIIEIPQESFSGCTALTSTGLEKNQTVTTLFYFAFKGDTALTSTGLTCNRTVSTFYSEAFSGCTALGIADDVTGQANKGDLVLNQPDSGGKLVLSADLFKGSGYASLYLMCDKDRLAFYPDMTFSDIPLEKVYVPASWAGTDSWTICGRTFSVSDGTLVIMDPIQSLSVDRKHMTSDAATLSLSANASFEMVLSGASSGSLGTYRVSVDAAGAPQRVSVDIPSGSGLGPAADALAAAVCPETPVAYPAGSRGRGYNESTGSASCAIAAVRYDVRFDANAGVGSIPDEAMAYGQSKRLSANENLITRENYVFSGWNAKADGGGDGYADGEAVSNLTDLEGDVVTLFAQWESAVSLPLVIHGHALADGGGGAALPGCGFALASQPDEDHEIYSVYTDEAETKLVERWPMMTDANGDLNLYGLSPGTYHILNLTAPAGYQLMAEPHAFTVFEDGGVSVDGGDPVKPEDGVVRIGVGFGINPALPGTGGLVRPQLVARGAAVLALWAALLALRVRRVG
ncbi:leucine-rich repeat protein [Coriobacterium glomerans]|uniref:leucine-rich repeat protein n=1 Tax=Coriobacterium glomerans TaxID=33871 RepID=UPI00155A881D|nr:leucine-rich repeat protein [Coriobacterium glomerans]